MKYQILSLITAVFLLMGCASADVMLLDPSRSFPPTENVLLLFEEPEDEYEIIAIIEAKGSQYNNQSEVVRAAQKKAGKIGAHGIIPMTNERREVASEVIPNPVAGSPPIYIAGGTQMTMKFAAIRYIR
ncbi:MAG: hypothetical protein JJU41_10775 [Bacteroidetes bacterium]|nr:hypothetical protein [Bacteroidota bacterium]MCH8525395.1 hypothetical protein [Balneolales bacterium]